MTVRLSPRSEHAPAAARFGAELTRAMAERAVGQAVVKEAAGVSRTSVVEFRHGRNLPTLPVAQRLAEALRWPKLETIVREARTRHCQVCPATFIQDTGRPRRYCSNQCRTIGAVMRGEGRPDGTAEARSMLLGEVLRAGPARKQVIGRAVTIIEDSRQPEIAAANALTLFRDSVAAMCRGCAPEGYCPMAECELRPVSPLPLAGEGPDVATAMRPPGMQHDAAWLAATRAGNARRWARPGEKESASATMRQRHASMSDEERAAIGARISAGRRKTA